MKFRLKKTRKARNAFVVEKPNEMLVNLLFLSSSFSAH
jgi:hypothetical protein